MVEFEQFHVQEYIDLRFPDGPPPELTGGDSLLGEWGVNLVMFDIGSREFDDIQQETLRLNLEDHGSFDYWDIEHRTTMGKHVVTLIHDGMPNN